MARSNSNHQIIYGIDAVRFTAAILVTAYHLAFKPYATPNDMLHQMLGGDAQMPPWWRVTWFGWIGVQIFFVISGYVIAYSSEEASGFAFLRSRVARLAPAMWISAGICAAIMLFAGASPLGVGWLYLKSALFMPIGPWLAGQFWTLGVEIAFYGIILILVTSRSFGRLEALTYVIAGICAAYWVAVLLDLWPPFRLPRLTALLLLQHGCYFALGMMFWLISRRGLTAARIGLCAVCILSAAPQIMLTCRIEAPNAALVGLWYVPYLFWLLITACVALSIRWPSQIERRAGRWTGPLRRLGMATYPLYLLHFHVGGAVLLLVAAASLPVWGGILLGIAAAIASAFVEAELLEPPLRRLVSRGITALHDGLVRFVLRATQRIPRRQVPVE